MSEEKFAGFLGLTGYTAEQLDKGEKEHVNIIQSNPNLSCQAGQEKLNARFSTMTDEEIELWDDMEMLYGSMRQIALDDAKFALWRASVNESAGAPAQNPGGLLLEETSPAPAPVTNTDDSGETTPTPAPSSGSE